MLKDISDNTVYATIRMPVPGATDGELVDIYSSEDGSGFSHVGLVHVHLILGQPYVTFPTPHFSIFVAVPNNGLNISADQASNSVSGSAYTSLDNIVLSEVLDNDFAPSQTDATLILTAPNNWKFKA